MANNTSFFYPDDAAPPDFMIIGAMKAGTSSLHRILNRHPQVFVPAIEPHFFCNDDLDDCYETLVMRDGRWVTPAEYHGWEALWHWYSGLFPTEKEPGMLLGEDSTGYLTSRIALRRIAGLPKPPKIIISLRDPTTRAYSQYWHLVKTARASYSFENTLRFSPASVLRRSRYMEDLRTVFECFGRENVHIVLFEEFLAAPETVMRQLCEFLRLPVDQLPQDWQTTHANPAQMPRWVGGDLFFNRFLYSMRSRRYARQFGMDDESARSPGAVLARMLNRTRRALNPLRERRPPPINPATRALLDRYFRKELAGLDALVGRDAWSWWQPPA